VNAAYRLDGQPASREAFYATACDPRRHVCVEACAGAGKTWMLVARIVRALLDGALPHEILAITFTRKAAGEMRTRLNNWLREASTMTPAQAASKLRQFGLDAAQAEQRAAALIGLHERVLESGRAVEVRTMHAWYAQLLAAAPLDLLADLGLAPGLTPLENRSDLMPALMQRLHRALLGDAPLRAEHRRLTVRHGRFNLARWLDAALERRGEIELADAAGVLESSVPEAAAPDAAARVRDPEFRAAAQSLAFALGQRDKYRDKAEEAAQGLIDALAQDDARAAYDLFRAALFTDKGQGTPKTQLGELPEQALLCDALDRIAAQLAQQDAHEDHLAMVRLSRRLFGLYAQQKRERGLVDMNDLEQVARALLSEHEAAAWVQQRLDARVRHLLIDEFQDTSALQWHALQGWLAAYAGAGGGAQAPRLFIVGDPKQSIYRFRRADPRVFAAAQDFVVEALDGSVAACDHTRRCAPGVVALINRVFGAWADAGAAPGLVHWRDHTTEIAHDAAAPVLAMLPSVKRPAKGDRADDAPLVWRPSLTVPKTAATPLLREAEADEVARAVAHLVATEGVAPQDILVLARKRAALTRVADALARAQVPHVAPEDLLLSQLPEAQDLLALLDVLASPTQSLSLAHTLKSPLFGASDADLLDLSRRAGGALAWWSALLRCAEDASASTALQRAARLCAAWAAAAPSLPPHDLLDRIVHEGELLPRLAAAVPPAQRARALDAVRALLAAALELDGGRYVSPYAFVRALRSRRIEAPASQQADAVRLLTIHGAKGLEARIVFLVDAQPEPPRRESLSVLVEWPVDSPRPARVAFVASLSRPAPSLDALVDEERFEGAREEANALYVALTRASERLVVSRTPPHHKREPSWWTRLVPSAQPWAVPQAVMSERDDGAGWAEVVALPSPVQPVNLRPQDLAASASDDSAAAALGRAVHRVLEWSAQPGAPSLDFGASARAAARAFGVADARAVQTVAERIWASADCRRFFDARSIAWAGNEVSVAAADGAPRRIDRLVLLCEPERAWWVLDYKLAGAPQHDAELCAQLADYRRAVAALVPGETVHAAFITGAGQLVMAQD
jgi:ATP-dependent helicase/nuclease subunit A